MDLVKEKVPPFISTLHQWLLASCVFSCFLLLGRMMATGSLWYIFLPWNLFLAFIPYWITGWLTKNAGIVRNKIKFAGALLLWLLFVPNSFYIITDLLHFARLKAAAPKWFDLLLIFSFAWNGIMFGIISLRRVELLVARIRGKQFSLVLLFAIMWLCAFGIYIGRYLRFNSWDIITNPLVLAGKILEMLIHPFEHGLAWGMTICYSLFMTFLYFMIKKSGENIFIAKQ